MEFWNNVSEITFIGATRGQKIEKLTKYLRASKPKKCRSNVIKMAMVRLSKTFI
jgi:hypothetical protein